MEASILDPVAASAAAAAAAAGQPSQVVKELGRDDFMRLLVAKLENQDPLNPAKDTEFVAELATFSSLEQLINANENLQGLAASQGELINAQALNLIGKEALVESGDQMRIKDGVADTLVYAIPKPARSATLTIYNTEGFAIKTFDLQTSPQGPVTIDWDGTIERTLEDGTVENIPLEDGEYRVDVTATDLEGDPMTVPLFRSVPIDGVNFAGGRIALVSGDREVPFEMILEIRAGRR